MCYERSLIKVIQPLTSITLSSVQDFHALVDRRGRAYGREWLVQGSRKRSNNARNDLENQVGLGSLLATVLLYWKE
jgi:hypothetical protein